MSTLKDVARKLNISVSTVSRVVNNKTYVKPETREKIMSALKELNYSPNQIARSLKKKSTNTVGVIVPDISEDFFAFAIKGIDDVLSKNGYTIILCNTDENPDKEELYIKLLYEKQIDGIILATVRKENKELEKLGANNIPIVFIDNLSELKCPYDSVFIDNLKAGYIATEHLISLGHRRIGIIAGKQEELTGYERLEGYKKALRNRNIPLDETLIKTGDYKLASGYSCMKSLLESGNKVTAVFAVSSKMTYGAIKAIREAGLNIPHDIAVVGFDVHDEAKLLTPGITTILQPEKLIGRLSGEMIIKRLSDKEDRFNQKIVLEPELMISESCGCCKK